MDSVLSLCASVCEAHQLVAVEALIHAADKAKRASFITANGVSLLKEIYKHSERASIRIRALVVSMVGTGCGGAEPWGGLWVRDHQSQHCPSLLGFQEAHQGAYIHSCSHTLFPAAGALQAGICWRHGLQHEAVCRGIHHEAGQAVPQVSGARWGGWARRPTAGLPAAGLSTARLRDRSPRWLCNEAIDAGTRRWAVEGLAYLTFDADVKEEFVEDKAAMQAMFHLAKVHTKSCGVGTLAPGKCAGVGVELMLWGGMCGRCWVGSSPGRSSLLCV